MSGAAEGQADLLRQQERRAAQRVLQGSRQPCVPFQPTALHLPTCVAAHAGTVSGAHRAAKPGREKRVLQRT